MTRLRAAVFADLLEEQWPSMDLVADMLTAHLRGEHAASVEVALVRPSMRERFTRIPVLGARRGTRNVDRLANRFWDYSRVARDLRRRFDVFHVVDHSYAQLVHQLPESRTVVTCHDLDTFRCLLDPAHEQRSRVFRAMTRRVLTGLSKAAAVICVSASTRDEILSYGLLPADRLRVIPNGVHPTCTPEPEPLADREADRLLGARSCQNIELLHVGSTVSRKRIDVLLCTFASVRRWFPGAVLVRVGGDFTAEQRHLLSTLGAEEAVRVLPFVTREVLAAIYRRAALVIQPSEREGFGLPVIEALACGTPVLASDLPVFREIAGDVIEYATIGNVEEWEDAARRLLVEREQAPERWEGRRCAGMERAEQYSWAANAERTLQVYQEIIA